MNWFFPHGHLLCKNTSVLRPTILIRCYLKMIQLQVGTFFVFHFQHISNGHPSPAKDHPTLGSTLIKFVRKEVGDCPLLPKKPLLQQDMEHILDCIGIENEYNLQRKYYINFKPDQAKKGSSKWICYPPVVQWDFKSRIIWSLHCWTCKITRKKMYSPNIDLVALHIHGQKDIPWEPQSLHLRLSLIIKRELTSIVYCFQIIRKSD